MHICICILTSIGSDNGLSPGRHQAIIWTNAGILLLIEPLGTNFSEILMRIQAFSLKKMHLKMSSAKWRPFCLGLNVWILRWSWQMSCLSHAVKTMEADVLVMQGTGFQNRLREKLVMSVTESLKFLISMNTWLGFINAPKLLKQQRCQGIKNADTKSFSRLTSLKMHTCYSAARKGPFWAQFL